MNRVSDAIEATREVFPRPGAMGFRDERERPQSSRAVGGVESGAGGGDTCAGRLTLVNSTDVSHFINLYFQDQWAGTLKAEWDHNAVVNSADVGAFMSDWFEDIMAGCG